MNVKHVIAVNSGTSALHASLLSIGIKQGDEVILPFYLRCTRKFCNGCGTTPTFADINKQDYTIDVVDIGIRLIKEPKPYSSPSLWPSFKYE